MKFLFIIFLFNFSPRPVLFQTPGYDINFNHVSDKRKCYSELGFSWIIFGERNDASELFKVDFLRFQENGIMSLLAESDRIQSEGDLVIYVSRGKISSFHRYLLPDFSKSRGMISNIKMRYNILGQIAVYYIGSPIDVVYEEPFYFSGNYGREDFFVDPVKNPKVKSKFAWNICMTPREGLQIPGKYKLV